MSVASLWIGEALGPIELASIRSFLRHHESFHLYSYGKITNVPDGVTIHNARDVWDVVEIIRHSRSGSPAPHADLFRYQLLAKTDHIWVDLDMIAFRPFDKDRKWLVGEQSAGFFNNAVLRMPKTSETLLALSGFDGKTRGVPPHLKGARRLKYQLRSLLTGGVPIANWPWGSLGPAAITHFLQITGEDRHALPREAFYFIPHEDCRRFVAPGALWQEDFPEGAWGVHLWANFLRQTINGEFGGKVPQGSYLATLLDE